MPPFSNKKKKEQLQLKRQKKRERDDDPNSFYKTIMQNNKFGGRQINKTDGRQQNQQQQQQQQADARKERFADLQFFKDTDEEIKLRKELAMNPIIALEEKQREVDANCLAASLDMPKRPPWDKSFTKEQLDRREQTYFKEFVNHLLEEAKNTDQRLSYFDLNLDTWRQLWRVVEMSDIVTIIVDIRHPLFHFPPTLYRYIVDELKKKIIIVLNKVDLVPASLVIAWQEYLREQYSEVSIVPFASYAGMKTKANGKRVGLLHMAIDGARRFMLQVEKMVDTKKIDLSSWKEKIMHELAESDKEAIEDDFEALDIEDGEESESDDEKKRPTANGQHKLDQDGDSNQIDSSVVTIGCVGHPNVGKSSFMNALIGKKLVSVSRTPGHTKHFQTIFLTRSVCLCDCPGLVFPSYYPKALQVLMGCYPISQLREPYSSITYMAERLDMPRILKLKIADDIRNCKPAFNDKNYTASKAKPTAEDWSAFSICESWAVFKGFLTARSGRPDVYRAANHLLRMALDGRTLCLSFYPPEYLSRKETFENHPDLSTIEHIQGKQNIVKEDDDGWR